MAGELIAGGIREEAERLSDAVIPLDVSVRLNDVPRPTAVSACDPDGWLTLSTKWPTQTMTPPG